MKKELWYTYKIFLEYTYEIFYDRFMKRIKVIKYFTNTFMKKELWYTYKIFLEYIYEKRIMIHL